MKGRFIIVIIALLFFSSCNENNIEIVKPTIAPITEAVFASGHIEALNQFALTALNDGYIFDVLVQEGDVVTKNQTLFQQDNSVALIQQQDASENVEIANTKASNNSAILQQLKAQLKTANQKLKTDKQQFDRMQRLYTTSSVSKLELENAQLIYSSSLNSVDELEQKISETKLDLKQSVDISVNQHKTSIINTNYFNIKTPDKFKVFSILKKKGELVRKGETVAILGDINQIKIILNIDEASISKIKSNQNVLIEVNTEKGKTYFGKISKVYPLFDEDTQSYKVEARIKNDSPNLINGSLLQANIIVASKKRALLIPKMCLLPDNKVIVKNESQLDTINVKTGIVSNEWVEILEGISQNQEIIKNNN